MSRPPWLTALALWRGFGAWGGGGLFDDAKTLTINQRGRLAPPDEGRIHPRFRVAPFGSHPGHGEDNTRFWHSREVRDGWLLVQPGVWERTSGVADRVTRIAGAETKVWCRIDPPMIYRRTQPTRPNAILEKRIGGLHELNGPWYALEHAVMDAGGRERHSLGRSDWAEWDARGDLLYAKDGRIYRVRSADVFDRSRARELFDLRPLRFTRRTSPRWAREWLGRRA